jgi:hypothetical protein
MGDGAANGEGTADSGLRRPRWWGGVPSSAAVSWDYAAVAADIRVREEALSRLDAASEDWHAKVEGILQAAREADHSVDARWALINLANRAQAATLSTEQLEAERVALLEEATSKLDGWRRATVEKLLADWSERSDVEKRTFVQRAMLVRDEAAANVHRKARLLEVKLTWFGFMLVALIAALLPLLLIFPPALTEDVELGRPRIWVFAFLFGAIGGTLSAIQRTAKRDPRARVPELLEQGMLATTLPFTGAAAALAAYPLAAAGLLPSSVDSVGAFLGVALAAGVSERLVVRAAQQLDKG